MLHTLLLSVLASACAQMEPASQTRLALSLTAADAAQSAAALLRADLERLDPEQRIQWVEPQDAELQIALASWTTPSTVAESFQIFGDSAAYTVAATGNLGWQYGAYEILEQTGILIAHPLQIMWPDKFCLSCPGSIDKTYEPRYAMRGTHIHTLHPLEFESTLLSSDPATLERFHKLVTWLVARRQNYIEWNLLRTVDFNRWIQHAGDLVRIAHDHGIRVGIVAPFAFRQQNSWMLLDPDDIRSPIEQIRSSVNRLMQVPWDQVNVEMGASEFFDVSDVDQVAWLDALAHHLRQRYPNTRTATKVHISSDQYAANFGNINFNYLPRFADAGVGVMPHSVQFYDLYRSAPTYGQKDFSAMRGFLLGEIGRRPVYYYPETAYWVTFDIDVPILLPQYIYSRWNDLYQLRNSGMNGQINFSSGFEWSYWMNDFASAWYAWQPTDDYTEPLQRIFTLFGSAADSGLSLLDGWIRWQGDELLEKNGIRWLISWDAADDIGELVGIFAQPARIRLHQLLATDTTGIRSFTEEQLPQLVTIAAAMADWSRQWKGLQPLIPPQGKQLYEELRNGIDITAVRADYMLTLYEGALSQRRFELGLDSTAEAEADQHFAHSRELLHGAMDIVSRQEQNYRLPWEEIAWDRDSLTSYHFGYLRTVSDLWYWEREYTMAADPDNFNLLDSLYDLAKSGGF